MASVLERGELFQMGKLDENKQQKEQRLMDAAFRLYSTQGIVKTSIDHIVKESGIAKGTFYLYFRDKYDLQDRLILYKAKQLLQHAREYSGYEAETTPEDKVMCLARDMLTEMKNDPALVRFINKNLNWIVLKKVMEHSDTEILDFFAEILGIKDEKLLLVMVYTVMELVGSSCYSIILENEPVTYEEYLPYLESMIRNVIRNFPKI